MHKLKEAYADEVFSLIEQVCRDVFARNDSTIVDPVSYTIGLSDAHSLEILKKIITAMPDRYVYAGAPIIRKNIQEYPPRFSIHGRLAQRRLVRSSLLGK